MKTLWKRTGEWHGGRVALMFALCVGMYRACSTWQYEVACHLLEARGGCHRLGYLEGGDLAARGLERAYGPYSWAALKCHDPHPAFARLLRGRQAVALYAHRDLRDVVDSMEHKMGASFDALMRQGLVHRILRADEAWRRLLDDGADVLIQRYDAILADPAAAVAEIARHLGATIQAADVHAIAAEYSLAANRRRADTLRDAMLAAGLDPDDPAHRLVFDGEALLQANHVREGRAGGWRGRWTDRQRALLDRLAGPWLVAQGYEHDSAWAEPSGRIGLTDRLANARASAVSLSSSMLYALSGRYPEAARRARAWLGARRAVEQAVPVGSSLLSGPHAARSASSVSVRRKS